MFPDGNTGFARLMVKTLIPDAFAGPRTVDAVWRNRVHFAALDRARTADAHSPERHGRCASSTRAIPRSAPHVSVTYAKGGRSTASARATS